MFTRKLHTDVCYLACARRLLAAPDAVFPQFATHNAQTLAAVLAMAGAGLPSRPLRVPVPARHGRTALRGGGRARTSWTAPAASTRRSARHETLLAYLVRRLLENGANTSFVNRIADDGVPARRRWSPIRSRGARAIVPLGAPHPRIALPRDLFGAGRAESAGVDLANEQRLASLAAALLAGAATPTAPRRCSATGVADGPARAVRNPADRRDLVGHVVEASTAQVDAALAAGRGRRPGLAGHAAGRTRAPCLAGPPT